MLFVAENCLVHALKLSCINIHGDMPIKLMKGKALRKQSLQEKTAASVLLKLFISGNE